MNDRPLESFFILGWLLVGTGGLIVGGAAKLLGLWG